MSAAPATEISALERTVRAEWMSMAERPYQRGGICSGCRRPFRVLTGKRPSKLECLECFEFGPPEDGRP